MLRLLVVLTVALAGAVLFCRAAPAQGEMEATPGPAEPQAAGGVQQSPAPDAVSQPVDSAEETFRLADTLAQCVDAAKSTEGTVRPAVTKVVRRRAARPAANVSPVVEPIEPVAPPPAPIRPEPSAPVVSGGSDARADSPEEDREDKVALIAGHAKPKSAAAEESPSLAWSAVSMLLKLALVLVLAYVTILVLKWLLGSKDSLPRLRRHVRILDTTKLSSSCVLHVVSVGGKTLLLGCSGGQVNLLRELDDESREGQPLTADGAGVFAEYLARHSGTSGQSAEGAPSGAAGRVAKLLRECSAHLKSTGQSVLTDRPSSGGGDEA